MKKINFVNLLWMIMSLDDKTLTIHEFVLQNPNKDNNMDLIWTWSWKNDGSWWSWCLAVGFKRKKREKSASFDFKIISVKCDLGF